MKKIYLALSLVAVSCSSFLDLKPTDKITGDQLFNTDGGINSYIAGMYYNLPIEDFRYDFPASNYNVCRINGGLSNLIAGPDAMHSEWNDNICEPFRFNDWESLYRFIRSFNELKANIPLMKPSTPETLDRIKGEYNFMLAYAYFALVKKYGGVPLIDTIQEYEGDYEALKVPRSPEVKCWRFILERLDDAIRLLPDDMNQTRANKWAAYALKSRVALYAASVGKFWNRDGAAVTGPAVDNKLVGGFTQEDIKFFYSECIHASAEVINSHKFALNGGEDPATLEQASENYRNIFINPLGNNEAIFVRAYLEPGITHNFGKWHEPNQLSQEFGGRCCPTLDLVESYAKIDPVTHAATFNVPLVTTVDGNEKYSLRDFNPQVNYKIYDDQHQIFAGRDPRLYASVILPDTQWGGQRIIIQGGIRRQDGSVIWKANDPYEFNGYTYYGKGHMDEMNSVSGWTSRGVNGTITGFLLKKYLQGPDKDQLYDKVTTPFVDLRYAEVLLNYAEAIAESGLPAPDGTISGKEALNKTRHRAGFDDNVECTPEMVRYERKAELGLEFYASVWDSMRRREYHTFFEGTHQRQGLVPLLDFTTGEKKYIFVRANSEPNNIPLHFEEKVYYRPIPGISANGLIQNPNY